MAIYKPTDTTEALPVFAVNPITGNPEDNTIASASGRTVFGENVSLPVVDAISATFQYNLVDPDAISTAGTVGGVVSASNGQLVIDSGTNDVAAAISHDHLRYKAGHELRAKFTAEFENINLAAGQSMFIGLMHLKSDKSGIANGFGIGYHNDGSGTSFGQWLYNNTVLTFIKQADFDPVLNNDGIGNIGRVWDDTEASKGGIFRIRGGYLGKAPLICEIARQFELSSAPAFNPFSYIDFSAKKGNHLGNPNLALGAYCSGGTNNIIRIGSLNGQIVGNGVDINRRQRIIPSTLRSGVVAEVPILAIRNNLDFNGLPNSIGVFLHLLRVKQTGGNAGGTMRVYIIDADDADLVVVGAWTPFSTYSPCDHHLVDTNTFTSLGKPEKWAALQTITGEVSTEDFVEDHENGNSLLRLMPDKILVVTYAATNAATFEFSGSIIELM